MESPAGDAKRGGEAAKPIAVFLLDDHEIVRAGVRDLLETDPGIVVVGEAGTANVEIAYFFPALNIYSR